MRTCHAQMDMVHRPRLAFLATLFVLVQGACGDVHNDAVRAGEIYDLSPFALTAAQEAQGRPLALANVTSSIQASPSEYVFMRGDQVWTANRGYCGPADSTPLVLAELDDAGQTVQSLTISMCDLPVRQDPDHDSVASEGVVADGNGTLWLLLHSTDGDVELAALDETLSSVTRTIPVTIFDDFGRPGALIYPAMPHLAYDDGKLYVAGREHLAAYSAETGTLDRDYTADIVAALSQGSGRAIDAVAVGGGLILFHADADSLYVLARETGAFTSELVGAPVDAIAGCGGQGFVGMDATGKVATFVASDVLPAYDVAAVSLLPSVGTAAITIRGNEQWAVYDDADTITLINYGAGQRSASEGFALDPTAVAEIHAFRDTPNSFLLYGLAATDTAFFILYGPKHHSMYDGSPHRIFVIDYTSGQLVVAGTMALPPSLTPSGLCATGNSLFAIASDPDIIYELDPNTGLVESSRPLSLPFDTTGDLALACMNGVLLVTSDTSRVWTRIDSENGQSTLAAVPSETAGRSVAGFGDTVYSLDAARNLLWTFTAPLDQGPARESSVQSAR